MPGALALTKTPTKQKPVSIEFLRLDYDLGTPAERERIRDINRHLQSQRYENPTPDGKGKSVEATKATIARLRQAPVALLAERRKIGGEEIMAADEFSRAFMALQGFLMFKPLNMERIDKGYGSPDWSAKTKTAVTRYLKWKNHWAVAAAHGDCTHEIMTSAIIDERPIRQIATDIGRRHSTTELALVRGLRDYAARAGWVEPRRAAEWIAEAMKTFRKT